MALTLEQRLEAVDAVLNKGMRMTNPLKAGTLQNKVFGQSCTGYRFQLGTLSYRGTWISTIESLRLIVDGQEVPQGDIVVMIHGMSLPIENLGAHTEIFWGVQDACIINVNKVGGLSKGTHTFEIEIAKRMDFGHSYGNGADGYEDAAEFHHPIMIREKTVYTIEEG